MNEIDLYVQLADDKETDDILKHFNVNVKGDNHELKKMRLKAVLKGQLPKRKSEKNSNHFYETIIRCKQPRLEGLTENEFMVALGEDGYGMPDYAKLANLLIYYPEKFKDVSPLIEENINSGRVPFDLGFEFSSEEEVKEYIGKLSVLNRQKTYLSIIDKLVKKAVDNGLFKINEQDMEEIRKGTLIEWQKKYDKGKGIHLLWQYYYLKTHEDIDSTILNSFCTDILVDLLIFYSESYKSNSEAALKSKLSDCQKELSSLSDSLKKAEQENKENDKKLRETISKIESDLKQKNQDLNDINHILESERETSKIKQNELQERITELEKTYEQEKKVKESYERKIEENDDYLKRNFSDDYGQQNMFGVLSNMEINVSKEIFKEILFIPYKNWKERVKDVGSIYIQREGISTGQLTKIQQYCSQNNIQNKVISARNEKDLIEQIARLKVEIGGVY